MRRGAAQAAPCEVGAAVVKCFREDLIMKHFEEILDTVLNWELLDMTLSHRKNSGDIQKIKVRPVIIKDKLVFQAAQYTKTQVFHKNIEEDEMREWLSERIRNDFKQTQIKAGDKEYTLLSGKKEMLLSGNVMEQAAGRRLRSREQPAVCRINLIFPITGKRPIFYRKERRCLSWWI